MLAGLLPLARAPVELAEAEVAVGDEGAHSELLGEIAAQADPPDLESAEAHYARALSRADELGMRPLAAHCHLGFAKLYRRTGREEQAREHLTTATTMYRELRMDFWLVQGETELRRGA